MTLPPRTDALVIPDWPAPSNVRAVVTTRQLPGNSLPPFDAFNLGLRSGESEDVVQANRALLVRALALPSTPRWLRQVHGVQVAEFADADARPTPSPALRAPSPAGGEGKDAYQQNERRAGISSPSPLTGEGLGRGWGSYLEADVSRGQYYLAIDADSPTSAQEIPLSEPEADAAITRDRGVVLAILTADCMPILFCADDGSETAAAHAGWRGLSAGVIERCVSRMRTAPARITAWLGPAIGPASYEVGDEVRAAFVADDGAAASAFAPVRPGHWLCDLYLLARRRLAAAGIERVCGGGFDTLADRRFYSFRRDGARSGRFASLIWIAD